MQATVDVREPAPRIGIWGSRLGSIPTPVAEERAYFRSQRAALRLTGWLHVVLITLLWTATTAFCASMVKSPAWWEWAAVPTGFLVANFVEWLAHRYPMHHPMTPLRIAYEMHTLRHHKVFTQDAMEAESADDFDMVLFTPGSLAFFMIGAALPIALFFFVFVSRNAGWIFTALALDYYATYEYFHLAYHLPEDCWVGRLPGMSALRRHHTDHHDQRLMADWNFNVTFPIFDAVFGTRYSGATENSRL